MNGVAGRIARAEERMADRCDIYAAEHYTATGSYFDRDLNAEVSRSHPDDPEPLHRDLACTMSGPTGSRGGTNLEGGAETYREVRPFVVPLRVVNVKVGDVVKMTVSADPAAAGQAFTVAKVITASSVVQRHFELVERTTGPVL